VNWWFFEKKLQKMAECKIFAQRQLKFIRLWSTSIANAPDFTHDTGGGLTFQMKKHD
jgi:hypothetical protein